MWTISYKGCYIHGYTDSDVCRVQAGDDPEVRYCKGARAAKRFITLYLRKGGKPCPH